MRDEPRRRTQGRGFHWYNKKADDSVEPWKSKPKKLSKEREAARSKRIADNLAARSSWPTRQAAS